MWQTVFARPMPGTSTANKFGQNLLDMSQNPSPRRTLPQPPDRAVFTAQPPRAFSTRSEGRILFARAAHGCPPHRGLHAGLHSQPSCRVLDFAEQYIESHSLADADYESSFNFSENRTENGLTYFEENLCRLSRRRRVTLRGLIGFA